MDFCYMRFEEKLVICKIRYEYDRFRKAEFHKYLLF